jgi:hypothetical protein
LRLEKAKNVCKQEESPARGGAGLRQNSQNGSLFCPIEVRKSSRSRHSRQLEILAIRALDLADQVAVGQLGFLDAVDLAYEAAVWSGLVKAVGDDVVQLTLAAAFANARRPT